MTVIVIVIGIAMAIVQIAMAIPWPWALQCVTEPESGCLLQTAPSGANIGVSISVTVRV